jgi:hypothetical protein
LLLIAQTTVVTAQLQQHPSWEATSANKNQDGNTHTVDGAPAVTSSLHQRQGI